MRNCILIDQAYRAGAVAKIPGVGHRVCARGPHTGIKENHIVFKGRYWGVSKEGKSRRTPLNLNRITINRRLRVIVIGGGDNDGVSAGDSIYVFDSGRCCHHLRAAIAKIPGVGDGLGGQVWINCWHKFNRRKIFWRSWTVFKTNIIHRPAQNINGLCLANGRAVTVAGSDNYGVAAGGWVAVLDGCFIGFNRGAAVAKTPGVSDGLQSVNWGDGGGKADNFGFARRCWDIVKRNLADRPAIDINNFAGADRKAVAVGGRESHGVAANIGITVINVIGCCHHL